jgi:hypothetical protein
MNVLFLLLGLIVGSGGTCYYFLYYAETNKSATLSIGLEETKRIANSRGKQIEEEIREKIRLEQSSTGLREYVKVNESDGCRVTDAELQLFGD